MNSRGACTRRVTVPQENLSPSDFNDFAAPLAPVDDGCHGVPY